MSDAQVSKFVILSVDAEVAQQLATAGIGTPKLVKAASDGDLDAVVGESARQTLRTLFPVQ